jgi:2,4-dienoyl-CoA reductase (NADPH2)
MGRNAWENNRILKDELKRNNVQHLSGVQYKSLTVDGLTIERKTKDGVVGLETIKADAYVLCIGQNSERKLFNLLNDTMNTKKSEGRTKIYCIGGAKDASEIDAERSILEGYELARTLNL